MAERDVSSDADKKTDQAPATAQKADPAQSGGVVALRELIAKNPNPSPADVVAIVDAHRGDHTAIFQFLQQTFGNAYTQQVLKAMDGLRASISRKEVVAGDPGDPNSGYFLASQAEGGAKWRTADGRFTGTANKDGLDTTYKANEHDAVHGKVSKAGDASLAYERDGVSQGELYGSRKSGSEWEAGARRTDKVGDGAITYGARHQVTANGANDGVTAEYKDPKTTAGGTLALQDGHPVGELHGSHEFAGGQKASASASLTETDKGAVEAVKASYSDKQDTINGNVTHNADGWSGGVDATHKLDDKRTIAGSATVAQSAKGTSETVKGSYTDGKDSLAANVTHSPDGWSGGVDASRKLDDKRTVSGNFSVNQTDKDTVETLGGKYTDGTNSFSGSLSHHKNGELTGKADASHKFGDKADIAGSVERTQDGTTLSASANEKINPELSLSQKGSFTFNDKGPNQSAFSLGEKYRSGKVVEGLDLELGHGAKDYAKLTGSADAQIAPNLYAGAWGSYSKETGKQDTASLGASLTFTPNEKSALTAAGIINQDGGFEARLQYDLFKDKLNGISDIADHKKDALLSLFVSYQQGGKGGMLDDRFGAAQQSFGRDTGEGKVMAGIKLKF